MASESATFKVPWAMAIALGVIAHAPLPFLTVTIADKSALPLEPDEPFPVDLAELPVEAHPPPAPTPAAPVPPSPKRQSDLPSDLLRAPSRPPPEGADPNARDLAFMAGGDSEPPPPSNRDSSDVEPSGEPIPVVTGIPLESTVRGVVGVKVRVGNTYAPGFERDDVPPEAVKPYAGGQVGGRAAVSGGLGPPGSGTVGGGRGWQPERAAGVTRPARLKKRFRPRYPPDLVRREIEGDVVLRVEVTREGTTRGAELVRADHPELGKLALAIVKQFVWEPALKDGEPVDSVVMHTIRFEIVD